MAIAQNINLTQDKEAARLETIADLKSKRITEWLSAREFDAHILFENPLYAALYREAQATRAGHANLMAKLDEFISIRRFSAASVLSPEGNQLWHTPDASGLSAQLRAALKDAKAAASPGSALIWMSRVKPASTLSPRSPWQATNRLSSCCR